MNPRCSKSLSATPSSSEVIISERFSLRRSASDSDATSDLRPVLDSFLAAGEGARGSLRRPVTPSGHSPYGRAAAREQPAATATATVAVAVAVAAPRSGQPRPALSPNASDAF